MIPNRIEGANRRYIADGCLDLMVKEEETEMGPCMISAWTPSVEEMQALLDGGSVILYIYTGRQPPVALGVSKP